jgi:Nif-specific regulatory protein
MTEQDKLIKKNRELQAVLDAARVLTSSFDLEENLTSVMNTLARNLDMERGCVFLLDPASGSLHIVAAHGLSREEIRRGTYKMGEGIVGRVIETGSPMYIPDLGEEPRFLNRTGSRPAREGISFICMPIRIKDKTFGVLTVDRIYSDEHGGVDDDLRVLGIVSPMIAQFVKLWETYRKTDEEKESLRTRLKDKYSFPNVIGESERYQAVLKSVRKVAGTEATVLLLGESGTGKELISTTVHYSSGRARGPFVAVNCAALPSNLLEVELFGCEKGAFTGATARRMGRFELAKGGTVFLDEIGEMPVDLQAKLLRVLQERTFERVGSSQEIKADVRIIAATNRDLAMEVRRGAFREDLYWRLNVVPIVIPPLRERTGDVRLLATHYLEKFSRDYGEKLALTEEAMAALEAYPWPGNVRELANTLERLAIMSEQPLIGIDDLPQAIRSLSGSTGPGSAPGMPLVTGPSAADVSTLPGAVHLLERERIASALREHGHNQRKTAAALGLTPRQLGYKIKKYAITSSGA